MTGGVVSVGDHHEDGVKLKQDEAAPEAEAGANKVEDGEQLLAEEQLQPKVGLAELLHVGIRPITITKELGQWISIKVYYYLFPNSYNYYPLLKYSLPISYESKVMMMKPIPLMPSNEHTLSHKCVRGRSTDQCPVHGLLGSVSAISPPSLCVRKVKFELIR